MGSDGPGKQELESEVVEHADVMVCDSYDQCRRLGELQQTDVPRERVIELGELTSGMRKGRSQDSQISICDLTGTGVQDSAIANLLFPCCSGRQGIRQNSNQAGTKRENKDL